MEYDYLKIYIYILLKNLSFNLNYTNIIIIQMN